MTTMKRCENEGEAENVVIIDVDEDSSSNVNTNNIPKRRAKKPRVSKGLKNDMKFPMKTYIYIDDDDDVTSPGNHSSATPKNLSRSKRMYPRRGSTSHGLHIQLDDDKSVIQEKEGQSTDAVDGAPIEGTVVIEREKIKDTVEYKQAQEEELKARQLALKLQAEEAQQQRRLLERKKAEELRLLDIKKRQQQRVEEIRESQKQDEEIMNKKEMYRIEVQHNLKKLELTCHDMASLLCGLGILVKSPYTTSHQVHAAYKRALLRFHPDRACSVSDMRQQVEAEEKFKLISRMKEKVSNIPSLK
ncbi:putative Chaperone J-domain superfamily [Helianthus annuus]|nr:putative Chaperone J-domain superfamily [Helianthus annuus]